MFLACSGKNQAHLQWLSAVADRATCGLLATDGETMYREDLAKDLKEHFQDVLEALEEQGADDKDSLLGIGIGWHYMFACLLICRLF